MFYESGEVSRNNQGHQVDSSGRGIDLKISPKSIVWWFYRNGL